MEQIRRTGDTLQFLTPPALTAWAAAGGKKESEGPLAGGFDLLLRDTRAGQKSWEAAEQRFQQLAFDRMLEKAGLEESSLDCVFGGDLENQCTATSYNLRGRQVPYVGLYGACSTMAEGLVLAACFAVGGLARRAATLTGSHFCTAERQYRTPLEYGSQRTPTAQWTATCAAACLIEKFGHGPIGICSATLGRVCDGGVRDISNMGAAMAPAAASTIVRYFCDTGSNPADFDGVYTGDLGQVGSALLRQLLKKQGLDLVHHRDCGLLLFDVTRQKVGAGASGCGCSAGVLCAHILPQLAAGQLHRVLFLSTGALMSPTLYQQGESIPSVAHLVELVHRTE